jgi:L-amino acid N-acyltransferase YncA
MSALIMRSEDREWRELLVMKKPANGASIRGADRHSRRFSGDKQKVIRTDRAVFYNCRHNGEREIHA